MSIDLELLGLLDHEIRAQAETINLTAASNYVSPFVGAAMRPELNNIHCEGYAGRRFHEGQERADAIERLAIKRACELFGADHANVQPYRGTMANLAACMAAAEPGSTILGFACDAGGHYTTGGSVHLTSRLFDVQCYSLDPLTLELDYDALRNRVAELQPKAIIGGDTAYPGDWDWVEMRSIADLVGAALIVDLSQTAGLVLAGAVNDPVPHADIVTMATYKTLRGPRAGLILSTEAFAKRVDRAVHPVCQDGTSITAIAGIAAALYEASEPAFWSYCHQVVANAAALAAGLAARGYNVVTGGTKNHACLIDLRDHPHDGRAAAAALAAVGLVANANQIPFDPCPPTRPSGLRLGTPAATTLGMDSGDMAAIAEFVHRALDPLIDAEQQQQLDREVRALRSQFDYCESSMMRLSAEVQAHA